MRISVYDLFDGAVPESRLWELTPGAWIALDESIRSGRYLQAPRDVTLMRRPVHVLLMACSSRGEFRERAIPQLARHPVLWPLLVIRALDWAGPVRDYARHILVNVATRPEAARLMIPTAMRLRGRIGGPGLLDRANPPHVRRAGHRLLVAADPWTRLKADLLLLDDPDLAAVASTDLRVWCDQVLVALYGSCPEALREELAGLLPKAPEKLRARAEWVLR